MTSLSPLWTFLFVLTGTMLASASAADCASLNVTVEGVKSSEGQVMVAVNAGEAQFSGSEEPTTQATQDASEGAVTFTFDDLAPGTYAVRTFHDVDGNGELNSNMIGMPTEPWGMSNNPSGSFGPPSWDDASFEVGEDDVSIDINLN